MGTPTWKRITTSRTVKMVREAALMVKKDLRENLIGHAPVIRARLGGFEIHPRRALIRYEINYLSHILIRVARFVDRTTLTVLSSIVQEKPQKATTILMC